MYKTSIRIVGFKQNWTWSRNHFDHPLSQLGGTSQSQNDITCAVTSYLYQWHNVFGAQDQQIGLFAFKIPEGIWNEPGNATRQVAQDCIQQISYLLIKFCIMQPQCVCYSCYITSWTRVHIQETQGNTIRKDYNLVQVWLSQLDFATLLMTSRLSKETTPFRNFRLTKATCERCQHQDWFTSQLKYYTILFIDTKANRFTLRTLFYKPTEHIHLLSHKYKWLFTHYKKSLCLASSTF